MNHLEIWGNKFRDNKWSNEFHPFTDLPNYIMNVRVENFHKGTIKKLEII